jgi:vacuolar-type H+-ATPase subunit E/Vma4
MAVAAPSDQIRQMVNFILQEAHEKANEIRVKVSTR